jgi:hypothetical protein
MAIPTGVSSPPPAASHLDPLSAPEPISQVEALNVAPPVQLGAEIPLRTVPPEPGHLWFVWGDRQEWMLYSAEMAEIPSDEGIRIASSAGGHMDTELD